MAETKKNLLTRAGLNKLEKELQDLKVNRRQEIAEKIKEAREQGDLSENAEYDAAKDEQREIEERIVAIETLLKNAEVVDDAEEGSINIGCKVRSRISYCRFNGSEFLAGKDFQRISGRDGSASS